MADALSTVMRRPSFSSVVVLVASACFLASGIANADPSAEMRMREEVRRRALDHEVAGLRAAEEVRNMHVAHEILDLEERARRQADIGAALGFGGMLVMPILIMTGAPVIVPIAVAGAGLVAMKVLWDRSSETAGEAYRLRRYLRDLGVSVLDHLNAAEAERSGTNASRLAPTRLTDVGRPGASPASGGAAAAGVAR